MLNENFKNPIRGFVNIIKDHISKNTKAMILKLQDHFIKLEIKFDKTVSRRNYYVKGRRKRTLWIPFLCIITLFSESSFWGVGLVLTQSPEWKIS